MRFFETELPGCIVAEPQVFSDARGSFHESFNQQVLTQQGIDLRFVQANVSQSREGVLRGLHYQWPNPQGKWISVVEGEVWDVAVDIRIGSPHFGRWTAATLSASNRRQFWIPEGFAHGFVVLGAHATVSYLCTRLYDPDTDAAILWDDPALAIDWPLEQRPILSDKDASAPLLERIPRDRLPVFAT